MEKWVFSTNGAGTTRQPQAKKKKKERKKVYTPERRNPAPPTKTLTQASLTRKPWQATRTTPPTARKLHNKENSTNSQNTERLPQTQQYKQDEETEEYPTVKEQDKCPPNQTKEEEIGNLPDKEFWIMIVKMI